MEDLQVLQFETKDMKKVQKMAKSMGSSIGEYQIWNCKDGPSEVIFHTEAVPSEYDVRNLVLDASQHSMII